MKESPLRLLILGAHPDDAEYHAGGLASLYRRLGHVVRMVSVTDGSAGHQTRPRAEMGPLRRLEAAAAGRVIGAEYVTWDWPDGELTSSLEVRDRIIAEIRGFAPDLLLTHRPYDYHPDHRAVGQAVQDASFLVRVPRIVPQAPALRRDPVVGYLPDLFTRPVPLSPQIVVDIGGQLETVAAMLACHQSQVFDWLPWLEGTLDTVPADRAARIAWLRRWYEQQIRPRAERFRGELSAAFEPERGAKIEYVEAFEISQYASPLDDAARQRLFGSLPEVGFVVREA